MWTMGTDRPQKYVSEKNPLQIEERDVSAIFFPARMNKQGINIYELITFWFQENSS